jgi:hypothetical protein
MPALSGEQILESLHSRHPAQEKARDVSLMNRD